MKTPKAKKVFRFNDRNTNLKLGRIYTFSIAREHSCGQKSEVCWEVCYGGWNRPTWRSSLVRLLTNYTASRSAQFADDMIGSLAGLHPVAFRIHDVGDFYSEIYIRKWLKVVRRAGT